MAWRIIETHRAGSGRPIYLEVTLTIERASQQQVEMDHAMVASYIAAFRAAAAEHRLREAPRLQTILQLPGVFRSNVQGGNGNGTADVRKIGRAHV